MFSSLLISFRKMAKLNCSAFQLHKFLKQNFRYKEHCATLREKKKLIEKGLSLLGLLSRISHAKLYEA